jgi:hypothetical protein
MMGRERGEHGQVISRRGLLGGTCALVAAVQAGQPSRVAAQSRTASESEPLSLKLLLAASRINLMSEGVKLASLDEVIALNPESGPLTYLLDDLKLWEDPNLKVPPSITLGAGNGVRELRAWFNQVQAAEKPAEVARTATLVLFDDDDQTIKRYRLTKAWPAALRVANGSTPATLEIARLKLVFRESHALET